MRTKYETHLFFLFYQFALFHYFLSLAENRLHSNYKTMNPKLQWSNFSVFSDLFLNKPTRLWWMVKICHFPCFFAYTEFDWILQKQVTKNISLIIIVASLQCYITKPHSLTLCKIIWKCIPCFFPFISLVVVVVHCKKNNLRSLLLLR